MLQQNKHRYDHHLFNTNTELLLCDLHQGHRAARRGCRSLCQSWHRAWHFSTVPSTGEAQWGGKSQQWEHYTTIRHDAAKVVTPKASFLQPRHFVWQGLKLQSHQRWVIKSNPNKTPPLRFALSLKVYFLTSHSSTRKHIPSHHNEWTPVCCHPWLTCHSILKIISRPLQENPIISETTSDIYLAAKVSGGLNEKDRLVVRPYIASSGFF